MSFGFSVGDCFAITKLALEIRKRFAGATGEYKVISDEVKNLANLLQDAVAIPESELTDTQQFGTSEIKARLKEMDEDIKQTLEKYEALDSEASGTSAKFKRIAAKLKWDSSDVQDIRSRITSNTALLSAFLANVATQAAIDTKSAVKRIEQRQLSEEEHRILEWLSPSHYGIQHDDIVERRQAGTGSGFLESPEYLHWLEQPASVLFCSGMPGAGKTMLSSAIIDDLFEKHECGTISGAIAFLYCNYRRTDEQGSRDLIASLLRQLLGALPTVPQAMRDLYSQFQPSNFRPPTPRLVDFLETVVHQLPKVYIVLDALDECAEKERDKFIQLVLEVRSRTPMCVLATSRPLPNIATHFRDCPRAEIRASKEDVQKFLRGRMGDLPNHVRKNISLQNKIVEEISEAVDGMFLLAQLYLGFLEDKWTAREVQDALTVFQRQAAGGPKDKKTVVLIEVYSRIMLRIEEQKKGKRDLALSVLLWLTHARRPLSTVELQHAVAIELNGDIEMDGSCLDVQDIVSACAGLVEIDQSSEEIRLVHYTAHEYFEQDRDHWFPLAEERLMRACIAYISLEPFANGLCTSPGAMRLRLLRYPFYQYAASNWGRHGRNASVSDWNPLLEFFRDPAKVDAASQVTAFSHYPHLNAVSYLSYMRRTRFGRITRGTPSGMNVLHWTAHFGMSEALRKFVGVHSPEEPDSMKRTPLGIAVANNHLDCVLVLLSIPGLNPDGRCGIYDETPILLAASTGRIEILLALVSTGRVDVNARKSQATPLIRAIEKGHTETAKLLLSMEDVLPGLPTSERVTPLSAAITHAQPEIVELLLKTGKVDLKAKGHDFETPLQLAVWQRQHREIDALKKMLPLLQTITNTLSPESGLHVILEALEDAISLERFRAAKLLLDVGFGSNVRKVRRHNLFEIALKKKDKAMFLLLVSRNLVFPVERDQNNSWRLESLLRQSKRFHSFWKTRKAERRMSRE